MRLRLFHPGLGASERQAATVGLIAIILTGVFASLGALITDGMLDIHYLALSDEPALTHNRWLVNWAQGLVNLAWIGACLWVSARAIKTPIPIRALLAQLALARWPLVVMTGYLALPPVASRITSLSFELLSIQPTSADHIMASPVGLLPALELMAWSLPIWAGLAWMIWLMFDAYRRLIQSTWAPTLTSFLIALFAAQMLSQLTVL